MNKKIKRILTVCLAVIVFMTNLSLNNIFNAAIENDESNLFSEDFTSISNSESQLLRPSAKALEVGACNCPVV